MGYNKPRHGRQTVGQKASLGARTAVAGGAAAAVAGAVVLGGGTADAATVTASASTLLHARPDSGYAGDNWALDTVNRIAAVTLTGPDPTLADCGAGATTCYAYTGTISDTGTAFAQTGAISPGAQAVPIKGTPSAAITGNATVTFDASSDTPSGALVPAAFTGAGGVSTTNWAEQFFPAGTKFGAGPSLPTWTWTYKDAKDCQQWTDAYNGTQATSGDITGADSCTTTVSPVGNQTVTIGTVASVQVFGSTTGSDKALAYSATGLPDGLAISASTGLISGTPKASAVSGVAAVTVKDFGGISASTTVGFTVKQAAATPPPAVTVKLSGGRVVAGTLLPTRAEVAWTATPAAYAYRVTLVGPNFPGGRTGFVKVEAAYYEGLAAGHTYTVYVTPLNADGTQAGPTGRVTVVTPRG